jgi:hypothetical protein
LIGRSLEHHTCPLITWAGDDSICSICLKAYLLNENWPSFVSLVLIGYLIISKLATSTNGGLLNTFTSKHRQSPGHLNSRMSQLGSSCEQAFLVIHLLVNIVVLIIYWQCRSLRSKFRQTVWMALFVAGFLFLLLQHFVLAMIADVMFSISLVAVSIERYVFVACHHWHKNHLNQLWSLFSSCCMITLDLHDINFTSEISNKSDKAKRAAVGITIAFVNVLVLIAQIFVCWKKVGGSARCICSQKDP